MHCKAKCRVLVYTLVNTIYISSRANQPTQVNTIYISSFTQDVVYCMDHNQRKLTASTPTHYLSQKANSLKQFCEVHVYVALDAPANVIAPVHWRYMLAFPKTTCITYARYHFSARTIVCRFRNRLVANR